MDHTAIVLVHLDFPDQELPCFMLLESTGMQMDRYFERGGMEGSIFPTEISHLSICTKA